MTRPMLDFLIRLHKNGEDPHSMVISMIQTLYFNHLLKSTFDPISVAEKKLFWSTLECRLGESKVSRRDVNSFLDVLEWIKKLFTSRYDRKI